MNRRSFLKMTMGVSAGSLLIGCNAKQSHNTKSIDRPRSDKLFGERFALVAYPDKDTMNMVKKNWQK